MQFNLNQGVKIVISGEVGTIIARAEYVEYNVPQYQVRYTNAAGCAVEQWWTESQLEAL